MTALQTLDGAPTTLPADKIDALRGALRGRLVLPGDADYDTCRTIWNGMIDRRPGAIVCAAGAGDVIATVRFAREHGLLLAVKGGGHNIAGNAVCDGGLMLDLSAMKSVRVDVAKKRARVEPGALLSDFDRETQAFGLSTPTGINSTTGVAGLTLGGGFGWQSRKRGLTIDNLLSADVVLANGELVEASPKKNADLFWAIRGGGGNFGVVTSFEFRLHKVGPEILAGLIVYPVDQAAQVFEGYRRFIAGASDEMTAWLVLRKAPPLPFLPASAHGKEVVIVAFCYTGGVRKGKGLMKPLRAFGKPVGEMVSPMPLVAWQSAFDPLLVPGARNYWKSHDFRGLAGPVEAVLLDAVRRLPTDECEMFIGHLGGQVNRVGATETAYPHRDIDIVVNIHTRWRDAADDERCVAWARGVFDALTPLATGGVYVNFMPGDEAPRVAAGAYGANHGRLAQLKAKYDPKNLFRHNQNIRPGG